MDIQSIEFFKDGKPVVRPKSSPDDNGIHLYQLLGRWLVRDYLERRCATQEEAAKVFGIDVTTLRRLLTNRRFSQRTARKIIRVHSEWTHIPAYIYFLAAYESGLVEHDFIREIARRQAEVSQ